MSDDFGRFVQERVAAAQDELNGDPLLSQLLQTIDLAVQAKANHVAVLRDVRQTGDIIYAAAHAWRTAEKEAHDKLSAYLEEKANAVKP